MTILEDRPLQRAQVLARDLKAKLLERWGAEEILVPEGCHAYHVVPGSFWHDWVRSSWVEVPPEQNVPTTEGGAFYFDLWEEGIKEDQLWHSLTVLADAVAPKTNPAKTLVWAHYSTGGVEVLPDEYRQDPVDQKYSVILNGVFSGIGLRT